MANKTAAAQAAIAADNVTVAPVTIVKDGTVEIPDNLKVSAPQAGTRTIHTLTGVEPHRFFPGVTVPVLKSSRTGKEWTPSPDFVKSRGVESGDPWDMLGKDAKIGAQFAFEMIDAVPEFTGDQKAAHQEMLDKLSSLQA